MQGLSASSQIAGSSASIQSRSTYVLSSHMHAGDLAELPVKTWISGKGLITSEFCENYCRPALSLFFLRICNSWR